MAIAPSVATYEVAVDWRKGLDPPAGCVAWWRFDEGEGIVVADEMGVNDGTAAGGMTWVEGYLPGGFAGEFDGVDDSVDCGTDNSIACFGITEMTWEFIIYPRSDGEGNFGRVFHKNNGYHFYVQGEAVGFVALHLKIFHAVRTADVITPVDIPIDTWSRFFIVYNEDAGLEIKVYMNGELVTLASDITGLGALSDDRANNLYIGNNAVAGGRTFDGFIDEVRIHSDVAMTAAEVVAEDALLAPITGDVKSIKYSRGRDTDLDKAEPGTCRLMVVDPNGKYIPENTDSVLYGYLLPARPVRIKATFDGTTYNLFEGFLDDVIPYPAKNKLEAFLPCVDGFDQLIRAKISMALQVDKLSGELYNTALDRAGWHAVKRVIDTGIDTYPLVHAQRQPALDFLQKIEASEYGFCYVDGRGYLNWEDRHHCLLAPHTVSQWTCTTDLSRTIEPTNSLKSVRNNIIITAQPKVIALALSDLWKFPENKDNPVPDSPQLEAGEARIYWPWFADANGMRNIAGDVVAPAATTDYLGNDNIDGSGADRTADVTVVETIFAGSAKLEVTNGAATSLYLTLLKIRGKIYTDLGPLEITAEDTESQERYQLRDLKIDLPYYQSADIMQGLADYQLAIKKESIPGYRVSLINRSDAVLTQILARKLSDRITLQNAEYHIDDEFHIDKMEHEISDGGTIHRCWWTLTRSDDYEYWILGTSALGITSRLAF